VLQFIKYEVYKTQFVNLLFYTVSWHCKCFESEQQDVAQVLSHRFAFRCLRFPVTYSCLSFIRSSKHEVALQQNYHNTVIRMLSYRLFSWVLFSSYIPLP